MSIGYGAILPLVALSARDLGASVGVAALVVGLIGVGQLVGDLPAGRAGGPDRREAGPGRRPACSTRSPCSARSWPRTCWSLAIAVFVTGLAGAVFSLARQAYLTEPSRSRMRARAMSTLGGTFRIGCSSARSSAAAIVIVARHRPRVRLRRGDEPGRRGADARCLPDVTARTAAARAGEPAPSTQRAVGAGRAPPGAAHPRRRGPGDLRRPLDPAVDHPAVGRAQGIDAATTSVIFGISAGVDMLLFYPGRRDHGPLRPGLGRGARR